MRFRENEQTGGKVFTSLAILEELAVTGVSLVSHNSWICSAATQSLFRASSQGSDHQ